MNGAQHRDMYRHDCMARERGFNFSCLRVDNMATEASPRVLATGTSTRTTRRYGDLFDGGISKTQHGLQ